MKVLIIQLKRAGDVVVTTPLISVLKEKWPEARVDFLVEKPFSPLLEHHPSVGKVQIYDKANPLGTFRKLRKERYDYVFDFQSSPRSALAVLASGARVTAGYAVPFWGRVYDRTVPRPGSGLSVIEGKASLLAAEIGRVENLPPRKIYLTDEEKQWASGYETRGRRQKIVGLVPTHRRESRRWHAQSFAELALSLEKAGHAVWLFWGPGEKKYVERLARNAPGAWVIPKTSFRQLAALFSRCDLVVSNDNGPMHIAVAVGAPTVTVYGPTDPRAWNPGGSQHTVVRATGLTCLECNLNKCPFGHECMRWVTSAQVFSICQQRLAAAPTPVGVNP